MKFLIIFLAIYLVSKGLAQDAFPVKIRAFSEKYEAVISLNEKDTLVNGYYDDFVPQYIIQIFDKAGQKTVLEAYTADFPVYLVDENNEAISDIKELPYGSQSVLLYEDYNFDGINDFALMENHHLLFCSSQIARTSCSSKKRMDILSYHSLLFQLFSKETESAYLYWKNTGRGCASLQEIVYCIYKYINRL